ncbi:DUF6290 family protein [Treponema socranskii]|uniref:DUF6290 family protein n=1 Tax=Treponema socranskii TaxID=53419 RepID=UPI003D916B8F
MAVMSVRMNREEEKMINYLSEYFEEEKSSIIKRSLIEMYENIVDRKVIDTFEKMDDKIELPKFWLNMQNELDLREAKEKLKSDLDKIPNCKKTA